MKKITIYLPNWLHTRITKLQQDEQLEGNLSAMIRTLLIFSVKDFEKFFKELEIEAEAEPEEEDPDVKGIRLMMRFFEEARRLEAVREGQNISFPGFPADFEPATNCLATVHTGETRLFNGYPKTPQYIEEVALSIFSKFNI